MAPLEIHILLHYYSRGTEFEGLHNKPQTEIVDRLVAYDILTEELTEKPIYKITSKGRVWVEGILKSASMVSMPVWAIID